MAIWHFTCTLVPRKWLDHDVGRHLIHKVGERPAFESAWRTRENSFSIIEFCDNRFRQIRPVPQAVEYKTELQSLTWDCANGNAIRLSLGHDVVSGVTAFIDTRQAYGEFSTTLLELSVLADCLLYFDDSGRIVEPIMEILVAAIGGSEAARAARDPESLGRPEPTSDDADIEVTITPSPPESSAMF